MEALGCADGEGGSSESRQDNNFYVCHFFTYETCEKDLLYVASVTVSNNRDDNQILDVATTLFSSLPLVSAYIHSRWRHSLLSIGGLSLCTSISGDNQSRVGG